MRNCIISLLLTCVSSIVMAQESFAQGGVQATLPQLYITLPSECFSHPYTANAGVLADYHYGSMRLMDTDSSIVTLPIKCKMHGATARQYTMKPSLAIKLCDSLDNELDANLLGLRESSSWLLDAMAIDRINMRNRVAFDIWNDMSRLPYETQFDGRNGTVGRFVELYINGDSYGIYCLTDKINRKLLGLKKPKLNADGSLNMLRGALYKSGTTDVADQSTPGYFLGYTVCVAEYHNAWELKEPEDWASEAAWAPLMEFYNGNQNYDYVKMHYYLNNLVDNQLLVMALSIVDNWGNKNKYVSVYDMSAEGDGARLVYTPWDLDTSLGGAYDGSYYNGTYSQWHVSDIAKSATQVFAPCVGQPEYQQMLRNRWIELRGTIFAVDSVAARLRTYTHLLEGSGAWQRQWDAFSARSHRPKLVEDLSAEVEQVIEWYRARYEEMDAYFGTTDMPSLLPDNEFGTRVQKVLSDGQILILRDGRYYDLNGNVVRK